MQPDLVAEAGAVSLVLFVGLVLCFPLVLAMIGTVEGGEMRPLDGFVTWMRIYRARHRRGRQIKGQWDVQLAHAGGRYEELPTVAEYDTDTLRLFHDLNAEDVPRPGQDAASIFDRLSDTDCFAAINWDIHRAVNELAVLQRDLWAGYKLPPWKGRKR